mmetsp:Transcript_76366/g.198563  ORF Transcript_76366/g.198563 Transcript_76366/m.198563 type:complete len:200 (+) Transcript_76366:1437-2036(+)
MLRHHRPLQSVVLVCLLLPTWQSHRLPLQSVQLLLLGEAEALSCPGAASHTIHSPLLSQLLHLWGDQRQLRALRQPRPPLRQPPPKLLQRRRPLLLRLQPLHRAMLHGQDLQRQECATAMVPVRHGGPTAEGVAISAAKATRGHHRSQASIPGPRPLWQHPGLQCHPLCFLVFVATLRFQMVLCLRPHLAGRFVQLPAM